MSEESGITIKFGSGFDHPWYTPKGTVEELRQQLSEASGIPAGNRTLFELTVEASLQAFALTNAANGIGQKPKPGRAAAASVEASLGSSPTTPAAVRESIAQKAATSEAKATLDPAEVTDDIEALIAGATSRQALLDVRAAHKAAWTDAHTAQAKARLAELEN